MRNLVAIGGLVILFCGATAASAQTIPDLKGTWTPAQGAHIIDGTSRHTQSGTAPADGHDTAQRHTSPFTFRLEGQDGRTFWGALSSAKVTEKLIGAISVDGKRFVMVDEDGSFTGTIVDGDTLDYCYTHVTPDDQAVACGLLVRQK